MHAQGENDVAQPACLEMMREHDSLLSEPGYFWAAQAGGSICPASDNTRYPRALYPYLGQQPFETDIMLEPIAPVVRSQ